MSWKYRSDEIDNTLLGGLDLSLGGGQRPPAAMFHTGNTKALNAADGANSTPVITEIYVAAVFVPFTCLATGVSVFNGSVVATDKNRVLLYNANGDIVAYSAAAGAQPANVDAYDNVAFSAAVVLPTGTYYIGTIYNGTTNRFNAHAVGGFPGGKITGAVFATAGISAKTSITVPTAFTAAELPPIASLY